MAATAHAVSVRALIMVAEVRVLHLVRRGLYLILLPIITLVVAVLLLRLYVLRAVVHVGLVIVAHLRLRRVSHGLGAQLATPAAALRILALTSALKGVAFLPAARRHFHLNLRTH